MLSYEIVQSTVVREMCALLAICLFVTVSGQYTDLNEGTASMEHNVVHSWAPEVFPFRYSKELGVMYRRSMKDECQACYAPDQCFEINVARCLFFSETSKILKEEPKVVDKNPNPKLRTEVDSLLFNVIEKAKEADFPECIPHISKYTDCTKDNICMGCKTCDCSNQGTWNCSISQTCRPDLEELVIDHRVLQMVMENLGQMVTSHPRHKRSNIEEDMVNHHHEIEDDITGHAKLTQWIESEPTLNVNAEKEIKQTIPANIPYAPYMPPYIPYSAQYHKYNTLELEPSRTIEAQKNDSKILKFIVNSIIEDALPKVFDENSFEYENNRVKRWLDNKIAKNENLGAKVTFAELTDWLHDVHPYMFSNNQTGQQEIETAEKIDDNVMENDFSNHSAESNTTINTSTTSNPEILAFDEVYYNIASNMKYTRRKPLDSERKIIPDADFNMYDDKYYYEEPITPFPDEESATNSNTEEVPSVTTSTEPPTTEHDMAVTEAVTQYFMEEVTEVVVDLLESAKKNALNEGNETEFNMNFAVDNPRFNHLDEVDSVNVMKKRDVSSMLEEKKAVKLTSISIPSPISPLVGLKDTVLEPLNNVLKNKNEEIDELLKIKGNLLAFVKAVKSSLNNNANNTVLSIYKVEVLPHHLHKQFLRSSNATLLDKYLFKLKRDVYEVIKDIIAIKKLYKNDAELPDDIRFLIRSMKHYIYKTGFRINKPRSFRRSNSSSPTPFNTAILSLLKVLDRSRPQKDALEPLAQKSKKLLKRIIKKNYIDEFAHTGLKVYDPNYNLTNDLRNIGTNWKAMLAKVENSSIFDQLYSFKHFHLQLSADIAKMSDALALIDFARSRRMIPVDESAGEDIMAIIDNNLKMVNQRIFNALSRGRPKPRRKSAFGYKLHTKPNKGTKQPKKKESFMSQIKNLLKSSKSNILRLLHDKVPKSKIVKDIARKQAEDLTMRSLSLTMQKWQENLNIQGRKKRSASDYDQLRMRIKNIIPKYLRGKVSGMTKKGRNKKSNMTNGYKKKQSSKTKLTSRLPKIRSAHPTTKSTIRVSSKTTRVPKAIKTTSATKKFTTTSKTTVSTKSLVSSNLSV